MAGKGEEVMRYLLRAHDQLTGKTEERQLGTKPRTRKEWETLTDRFIREMQAVDIEEFEGYIELVDSRTGEQVYKISVEWPS